MTLKTLMPKFIIVFIYGSTLICIVGKVSKIKKIPVSARVIDDYVNMGSDQPQPRPAMNNVMRDSLYMWYWKMPEIRAIISGMVSDVFGEGYGLEGDKPRQAKTNRFLRRNRFNTYGKAVLRDALISGDGYMGKASLTESQLLEAMDVIYTDVFHKSSSPLAKQEVLSRVLTMKPDIYSPKVLYPLMSRGMYIKYDVHGRIIGYVQRPKNTSTAFATSDNPNPDNPNTYTFGQLGSKWEVEFLPEEVIHFPYEPVGDQVYGNSPIQTAIYDVLSLWYAKTYGGLFFQNDATPSYIFNLPEDSPDSQNYKKFVEVLKEHRQNPHRNMVITGNVGINKVASLSKDLEFSNFIDKFTQKVMLAFGATARFQHLFSKGAASPVSMESYYKQVNSIQTEYEDTYNNELFDQFGVEFYFNRVYKRDETREADIAVKLTNLTWTVNEAREFLGFKPLEDKIFDELPAQRQDALTEERERKKKEEVASADARTAQNAENPTSRQVMIGDNPVNGEPK
jgi:HK97 family phage portal protein